jgi:hypothetical protein
MRRKTKKVFRKEGGYLTKTKDRRLEKKVEKIVGSYSIGKGQ